MQKEAIESISASLIKDPAVQSVFVKGSIGRGEDDEHSDIDLYCLVNEEDEDKFLLNRLKHLEAYRKIMFYEDLFIIAPQIIAVYDNLLHVDLFTVTGKTFVEKDYFKIIYDPDGLMEKYKASQNLYLSSEEFHSHAYDVAWFLFQYRKAVKRGNDLWAVEMLHHVMPNLAKVLLHRYTPGRAQLGIKALSNLLPEEKLHHVNNIYNYLTPSLHRKAAANIAIIIHDEISWIESESGEGAQSGPFLRLMISLLGEELDDTRNSNVLGAIL